MQIRVLGCGGGSAPSTRLSCYLVDDVVAIDAGALTNALPLAAQHRLVGLAVTHTHMDHVWSLPLFLANRFMGHPETLRIVSTEITKKGIADHIFNGVIWPNLANAKNGDVDVATWDCMKAGETKTLVSEYELTACEMNHSVPCTGYLVRHQDVSVLLAGDTTTTDDVWALANRSDDLKGIFVECSFPNEYRDLASKSGHMTPELLAADLTKLQADIPISIVHVKPGYREAIRDQLKPLGDDRLRLATQGQLLTFG